MNIRRIEYKTGGSGRVGNIITHSDKLYSVEVNDGNKTYYSYAIYFSGRDENVSLAIVYLDNNGVMRPKVVQQRPEHQPIIFDNSMDSQTKTIEWYFEKAGVKYIPFKSLEDRYNIKDDGIVITE